MTVSRSVLVVYYVILVVALVLPLFASVQSSMRRMERSEDHVSITVDPSNKMNIAKNFSKSKSSSGRSYTIKPEFIGFSIEVWSIMYYMEQESRRPKAWFLQLMKNLKDLSGVAPRIRLGGNSGDKSWYNPHKLPKEKFIVYDVDDNFLYALQNMSEAIGTKWVFGVNFVRADNSSYATDYVKAISKTIDWKYVAGFQIGNEPEHFDKPWDQYRVPPYTFGKYLEELEEYERVISSVASKAPSKNIFQGPDFCCNFLEEVSEEFIKIKENNLYNGYTYHLYPLSHCDGIIPTIQQLLDDAAIDVLRENSVFIGIANTADTYNTDWYLGESNNVVCEGYPGVSDTFAGALWALDWMFSAAYLGASGINFHGSGFSSYSPIIIDPTGKNPYPTVMPQYYALLMFNYMIGDGADLLDIKTSTNNHMIKVWSVKNTRDGTIRVLLLHKDIEATSDAQIDITIVDHIQQQYETSGELIVLQGRDMYDNRTISLAGQTLVGTRTGKLSGERKSHKVKLQDGENSFRFALSPASAYLFSLSKTEIRSK